MNPLQASEITPGMDVAIIAPPGHPLRGARGVVTEMLTAQWLRQNRPSVMLTEPVAWLTGQVVVTLHRPPEGIPGRYPAPAVTVRPEDLAAAVPPLTGRQEDALLTLDDDGDLRPYAGSMYSLERRGLASRYLETGGVRRHRHWRVTPAGHGEADRIRAERENPPASRTPPEPEGSR